MSEFFSYQGKIVRKINQGWPNAIVEYWTGEQVAVHGRNLEPPIDHRPAAAFIEAYMTSMVSSQNKTKEG